MSGLQPRCVVLDVDDTLYLERDYVRSGFFEIERLHGLSGFGECAWQLFLAGIRGNTIDRALSALGRNPDADLVQELVRTYRRHQPDIRMLPDVLDWLEQQGPDTRLACVTDGPLASQQAKISALQLEKWCPTIVMTAQLGEEFSKPHVRAFQEVAESSGLPPQLHVYVADNPRKDFDGPRTLGWRTVRIRRTGSLHVELPTPDFVDHEVPDFHDLARILDQSLWNTTGVAG